MQLIQDCPAIPKKKQADSSCFTATSSTPITLKKNKKKFICFLADIFCSFRNLLSCHDVVSVLKGQVFFKFPPDALRQHDLICKMSCGH